MKKSSLPKRPERYDHLPQSPYASLFIEKLLLAIIEENPTPQGTFGKSRDNAHLPKSRLARAMKELFGVSQKAKERRDLTTFIEKISKNISQESDRQHEIQILGKKPDKTTVPFSESFGFEGETQTDHPRRSEYVRLLKKYKKKPYFDYLYFLTNVTDHQEELDMQSDLQVVAEVLQRWNVGTVDDPDRLGMYSLTHFWPTD